VKATTNAIMPKWMLHCINTGDHNQELNLSPFSKEKKRKENLFP
jgi:hypothetical protein